MTGGADCFVAEGDEYFVTGGVEYFEGTEFLAVLSACCQPNLCHVPLPSCKWGNVVPMYISLQLVWT